MRKILAFLSLVGAASMAFAGDKPNILWITSEDNASHWLGCYGNEQVRTPRLDALAAEGVRFRSAYSNAPVCAVARSTILNGAYAPTQGTQHMRSRYEIPTSYLPYVHYLRKAGYYCSNRSKTDYNFKGKDQRIWDDCSGKAHYKNRKKGQPFFAIFNLTVSHESSLFQPKVAAQNKRTSGGKPRIPLAEVKVPPYLPDLPEIRHDLAVYHDTMELLDSEVGKIFDDLEGAGLAENTIVLYYSDHGGVLPRGKRYLYDTGVRVPMILHVPEKWKHLSPFASGVVSDEVVSFVDLAPTVLSLAGVETPGQMQGRAFLGEKRKEPRPDSMAFLYADRFDETLSGMRRGITDGRWKYIRRFYPHMPAAPYSFYQFGQAGWRGWRKAWQSGALSEEFNRIWESPQPVEELYDTQSDPWEINNLAGESKHATQLAQMRDHLQKRMVEIRDSSVIPEPLFEEFSKEAPIAEVVTAREKDLPDLVALMFAASSRDVRNLSMFKERLSSADLLTRYWAAVGCLVLGKEAEPAAEELVKLLADPNPVIRITAAHALTSMGRDSTELLVSEVARQQPEMLRLYAMSALLALEKTERIPLDVLEKMVRAKMNYGSRFARELIDLRVQK